MFIFSWKVKLYNVVLGKREQKKREAEDSTSARLWSELCLYSEILPLFSASSLVSGFQLKSSRCGALLELIWSEMPKQFIEHQTEHYWKCLWEY